LGKYIIDEIHGNILQGAHAGETPGITFMAGRAWLSILPEKGTAATLSHFLSLQMFATEDHCKFGTEDSTSSDLTY